MIEKLLFSSNSFLNNWFVSLCPPWEEITLPIILAYGRSNSKERKFWKKVISDLNQEDQDFEEALSIIKKYNCIEDTIKRAQHFSNVAIDSVDGFKSNSFKECLINLMQASIKRISWLVFFIRFNFNKCRSKFSINF